MYSGDYANGVDRRQGYTLCQHAGIERYVTEQNRHKQIGTGWRIPPTVESSATRGLMAGSQNGPIGYAPQ